MHTTIFSHAAASALVAGLVLASDTGAQERPRPQPSGPTPEARAWFSVFGASIGASVRDASTAEIAAAGLAQPGGAFVTQVAADGPAAKAGLAVGDVVAEFDGERVRGAQHLVRLVRESATGRGIRVAFVRDKARRTADVTPTDPSADLFDFPQVRRELERATRELSRELPGWLEDEGLRSGGPLGDRRRFGIELIPLSSQLAAYFGVKQGLLVASVQEQSPAAMAGVRAGDVVLSVNGRAMRDVNDFVNELARTESDLTVSVMRDKKEVTLKATLPERTNRVRTQVRSV